jgi:preprotein translocase subunit SecF
MEIFVNTKFDFLGRRRYFIALSLLLILAGTISLVLKGGPKLGIDFKGGTLVYIKFKDAPRLGEIRSALTQRGLVVSTLQPFEEGEDSYELKIDLDLAEDAALSSGKEMVTESLRQLYPGQDGKIDFNAASAQVLAERLKANGKLAASGLSFEEIDKAAAALVAVRDDPPHSGLIKEFSETASVPGVNPDIISALQEETYLGEFTIRGVEVVGPKVGGDLQWQAIKATLFALGAMLIYIAFRFEWVYGVAAVIAVFHDVFVTVGFFSIFNREIDLNVVAALLTLVGYSMNDTIVIFDRVRENLQLRGRVPLEQLLNESVNQTLGRSVLTSGLTFLAVLCLYVFGGEVLRGFAFALVVGVVVGSYSTIFIASPIVLWWRKTVTVRGGGRAAARARGRA